MHDLVQEMGRRIAREQRSRLFSVKDVYQVLTNNQRDGHVQAISFDLAEIEELEHASFGRMYRLRYLHVSEFCFRQKDPLIVSLDLPNSLRYLNWKRYPLESLPSKYSVQNLCYLDMSSSEVGAHLWNEEQGPVNLKWIILRGCRHLTKVPNLSRSIKIECIDLRDCQNLVEIPSYFQHLGKLTYLFLGNCKNLKNLPEMPCNLEFLDLFYTAIEELPSSVWSHEKISYLNITFCQHLKSLPSNTCKLKLLSSFSLVGCNSLVSLPTNIWKMKSLKILDLSSCPNFQYFPEISEAMEHLEVLDLSRTAVKELPPSIGNLVALRKLDLWCCNNLVSLPTNIWKLKSLKSLDLRWCSEFQYFPEISEAMEHLEVLNLSCTAVKELPLSIGNLVALRNLYLNNCESLVNFNSCSKFQYFPELKSLPASIKQATQLSHMCLNGCKSLESLPELPPLLQRFEAYGCTSLNTVSNSSTAITQGWEEYIFYPGLEEKHIFYNCPMLDENARSNIMADAQLRIMRMATASSKFQKDKIDREFSRNRSFVAITCCGNEIPKWFSHKSEGRSIKIELPRDWFSTDFLGFALSLVVEFAPWDMTVGCKYNFKTSNGESHEVSHYLCNLFTTDNMLRSEEDPHGVFVWWYNNVFEEVVKGAESPTAFYKLVTEVNVDFAVSPELFQKVEKCGICLLYGKDAEMIKQRALYAQDS